MKFECINLLNEIRKNSRSSLTGLAYRTDTPLSTVYKRVCKLEDTGLISRHVALIDFAKIGYPFKVGIFVSVKKRKDFEEYIKEFGNLNTLLKLSGDYDYYVDLLFRNMNEYQDFEETMKSSNLVKKHKLHFIADLRQEKFQVTTDD